MPNRFFTRKTLLQQAAPVFMIAAAALTVSSTGWVNAKPPAATPAKPAHTLQQAATKQTVTTPVAAATSSAASASAAIATDPLAMLKTPEQYLNKRVTFEGVFNRFSDTSLDYKKAFRDSRDYVSFFILRPDVGEKTIPLSELKLFFPRKKSDDVMDLEPGDRIAIEGNVFSTALNEPWVDVEHIKIVKKTDKPERKHKDSEF